MIEITGVNKSFDHFQALTDLDLHVKKGSIYGLVGTNGAGKTTIIKHITGVLKPDSGDILMDGQSVYENISIKERMGFIPDDLYFLLLTACWKCPGSTKGSTPAGTRNVLLTWSGSFHWIRKESFPSFPKACRNRPLLS